MQLQVPHFWNLICGELRTTFEIEIEDIDVVYSVRYDGSSIGL
jgi:hypothetical protein